MTSARSRATVLLLGATLLASACAPPSSTTGAAEVGGAPRASTAGSATPAAVDEVLPVHVEGTEIVVRTADGTRVPRADLVGAVLAVSVDGGPPQQVRVDAIEADPRDATGEVLLYTLTAEDAAGVRRDVCPPDPAGLRRGFPLAGGWSITGEHLRDPAIVELTCTSGAVGKCVRMGYHPWKGETERARHQACTRMLRADYCGDGESHTREGTLINAYDPVGIQIDEPAEGLVFEAAWGPDGAVCVHHARVDAVSSLDDVVRRCPEKLRGRVAGACTEQAALADPRALVLNDSRPSTSAL